LLDQDQPINTDEIKHLLDIDNNTERLYGTNDVVHDEDEYESEEDEMKPIKYNNDEMESEYKALVILWMSQLSGWCSMCSVVLFWTSFISIDIYKGAPNHNDNHNEWTQFKRGLVFGAYGLLLTSLVSVNCSVLYPWLRQKTSTRSLYLFGEIGMAMLCILFYITSNETLLLILISLFGVSMQFHMSSCHELTESDLEPMFKRMRASKTKRYFEFVLEVSNVIAPVAVSLFGGPIVWCYDGEFKYLFLFAGSIQIIFDFFVLLMFNDCFIWKLPTIH